MNRWWLVGLFGIGVALASSAVGGWAPGTPARDAARVLAGLPESPVVDLPRVVSRRLTDRTVLVYFSPTCAHCRAVQAEFNDLSASLGPGVTVLGVASGAASPAEVATFIGDFAVPYPVVHDRSRAVPASLGARSTPAVYLLERADGAVRVRDAWTPFRKGWAGLVRIAVSGDFSAAFEPGIYSGDALCVRCHVEEGRSHWLTSHAHAWTTLQRLGKDVDPACVGCHVTGHGDPNGWQAGRDHLTNVGCEACHGPGGPHAGTGFDARSRCSGCHDAKHSIAFSVDKGIPHIDHFAANALDESAFRARLGALIGGDKARPLLAFSDGEAVGSEACASCHAGPYAWWQASSHAAPEAGGCEACHGPGGDHVASGGAAGTIEGLGESCPVCVIEALCTSCHTGERDPSWDLDARLAAIRHRVPMSEGR